MQASRASVMKSAGHIARVRSASSGISEIMNKLQTAKLRKIAEDYKLAERDVSLPIAKRFTHKEIIDIVEKTSGMTYDILALLDATRS